MYFFSSDAVQQLLQLQYGNNRQLAADQNTEISCPLPTALYVMQAAIEGKKYI